MRRKADQVGMRGKIAHVHRARSLRCVAMKHDGMRREQFGNPGDVLNGTDFIVNSHHGSEEDALVHALF